MPDVYLSPSTQDYNPYIIGGSEKYYMNLLADAMEPYLSSSGISYGRNDPNGNAAAAVARGNRGNYRLYLALLGHDMGIFPALKRRARHI